MGLRSAILLSLLAVQAYAAPGCTELCTSYHRTYQTQTSNGYQDQAGLTQAAANLQDNLAYARPGNWTEHNDYRTDGGHGNVHEERGQYMEGPKRVRFYKKNYTSSYRSTNGAGLSEVDLNRDRFGTVPSLSSQHLIDSQRGFNQYGNVATTAEEREYSRIHSEHAHSSSSGTNSHNANLEDFGVSGHESVQGQTHHIEETTPSNWRKVDSYKTDGGNGRVYEEEGQYVNGPKKVRYFKRNYTSSYSSGGIPIPSSNIPIAGTHDVHQELEKLQREISRDIQHLSNTGHRVANGYESGVSTADLGTLPMVALSEPAITAAHHTEEEHVSSSTSNGPIRQVVYVAPTQRVYSSERRSQYERREGYRQEPDHRYVSPTQVYTYGTSGSDGARGLDGARGFDGARGSDGASGLSGGFHETTLDRQVEQQTLDQHRSNSHQSINAESLIGSADYGQNTQQLLVNPSGQASHYREHWSSATHTKEEGTIPNTASFDSTLQHENAQYNRHHQYNDQRSADSTLAAIGGYHEQLRQNSFNSAHRTTSGIQAPGPIMMDRHMSNQEHSADCTGDQHSQHYQYETRYHRNYKRNADFKEGDVQLEQQTTDDIHPMSGKLEFSQQSRYPKVEDLTQQPMGKLEFGQERNDHFPGNRPKYSNEVDDLTQQTTGQFEFGQHTQQNEDLTQQSANFDDFSQQSQYDTQKPSRLNYPSISKPYSDFSQRPRVPPATGTLELGSQNQWHHNPETPSVGDQQLEDLTQQNKDLSQVSSGFDNFARPSLQPGRYSPSRYGMQKPTSNGHLEDLTENAGSSHDLSQQSNTGLEFGQQSQHSWQPMTGNQHWGQDFTQDEDFNQQTGGFGDLTQQTGGFDDYSQHMSGKLEFGHQSRYPGQSSKPKSSSQHRDDLTPHQDSTEQTSGFDDDSQQMAGKLEFGQQTRYPGQANKPESSSQHRGDLAPNNQDITQPTIWKLEFAQQEQDPHQSRKPESASQTREDLSQQTQDLIPQSMGKLEFGQQKPQHPWNPTGNDHDQDNTHQWNDLSQQTGKLEFGQETQNTDDSWKLPSGSQHREDMQQGQDFTQQTGGFDDLTPQTSGKLEHGQETQQQFHPWNQLSDLSQKNEGSTQQTTGHLELGQYQQQQHRPGASNANNHIFQSESNTDLHQQTTQHENGNIFQANDNYKPDWIEAADLQELNTPHHTLDFGLQKSNEEPIGVIPLGQQEENTPPHQSSTGLKPAEKPKPRPRYSKPVIITPEVHDDDLSPVEHSDTPKHTTNEDLRADQEIGKDNPDKNKESEKKPVSTFGMERENSDQVNRLDKSNDATIGLQWHYTYHPSDLINSEPFRSSYHPRFNYDNRPTGVPMELPQNPGNADQQESDNKPDFTRTTSQSEYPSQENKNTQETYVPPRLEQGVKGHRRPNMLRQATSTLEPKLEPRILEAYGGGPYDGARNDDIYSRVPPNPSATLPPLNGEDPWDIREKPRDPWGTTIVAEVETESTSEKTESEEAMTEVPPPSFWGRLGHKITNTFDKAREKARGIFG